MNWQGYPVYCVVGTLYAQLIYFFKYSKRIADHYTGCVGCFQFIYYPIISDCVNNVTFKKTIAKIFVFQKFIHIKIQVVSTLRPNKCICYGSAELKICLFKSRI